MSAGQEERGTGSLSFVWLMMSDMVAICVLRRIKTSECECSGCNVDSSFSVGKEAQESQK